MFGHVAFWRSDQVFEFEFFFNCRGFILLKLFCQTQSKNGSNFNSYVTSGRAEERKEPEGQTDEEEGGKGKREEEW